MKKLYVCGLVLCSAFMLTACGSKNIKDAPKITVLETIPANTKAPKWVKNTKEFWSDKKTFYYRGTAEGFTNLEAAKRAATANTRVQLAEQVKSTVRDEFTRALQAGNYEDTTGGYLKDTFFSVVDNLTVSGITVEEAYLQRLLETSELSKHIYYRAYVLSAISKDDYNKLVQRAFTDTKAQLAANKKAQALAAETETRFFKQEAQAD